MIKFDMLIVLATLWSNLSQRLLKSYKFTRCSASVYNDTELTIDVECDAGPCL